MARKGGDENTKIPLDLGLDCEPLRHPPTTATPSPPTLKSLNSSVSDWDTGSGLNVKPHTETAWPHLDER